MSIWSFKARLFAFLALTGLAACEETAFLGDSTEPLTQTAMAGGAMGLATPAGYCIDRRSLRRQFALIGRCDTLGVEGFFGAWELAIVTVSVSALDDGAGTPGAETLASVPGSEDVIRVLRRSDLTLTQLRTETPEVEGASDQYWRTAFVLNGQLVGLALYAPVSSGATGQEGARILLDIVAASRRVTAQAVQS